MASSLPVARRTVALSARLGTGVALFSFFCALDFKCIRSNADPTSSFFLYVGVLSRMLLAAYHAAGETISAICWPLGRQHSVISGTAPARHAARGRRGSSDKKSSSSLVQTDTRYQVLFIRTRAENRSYSYKESGASCK